MTAGNTVKPTFYNLLKEIYMSNKLDKHTKDNQKFYHNKNKKI